MMLKFLIWTLLISCKQKTRSNIFCKKLLLKMILFYGNMQLKMQLGLRVWQRLLKNRA